MRVAQPPTPVPGPPPRPRPEPAGPAPARPPSRPSWWTRNPVARYAHWLHTRWPAGTVERLPEASADGSTNVPGVYIVGDLTGIPLLKFSADSGARAVRTICKGSGLRVVGSGKAGEGESAPSSSSPECPTGSREAGGPDPEPLHDVLDLIIIGGGVSGHAAALEARKCGLRFTILESAEPFATLVNFPARKPIYTYPSGMTPASDLQFRPEVHPKEQLVADVREQTHGITPLPARAERIVRRGEILEVELEPLSGQSQSQNPQSKIRARRVIVAIGRSGNHRRLDVPGEDLNKVYNRLHDPKDYADTDCLVVGGGDSALETAIALAECGARVTLSYRGAEFSRPKPDNVERLNRLTADPMADGVEVEHPHSEMESTAIGDFMAAYRRRGSIRLMLSSHVRAIRERDVVVRDASGADVTIPNDAVLTMIGREAPLDFFRRSGVRIRGEWRASSVISLVLVLAVFVFVYHWKKSGVRIADVPGARQVQMIGNAFQERGWFPYNVPPLWASLGGAFDRPSHLLGVLKVSLGEPGFYYSLAYCAAVVFFGLQRIRRRPTPYIKWQTYTLMAVQCIPLFVLPYLVLPWMGHNGWFDGGALGWLADHLFPQANYGHGREYWRAFGLILAWPLFIWNVFNHDPLWLWLGISFVQTFVLIPFIIYFWGKGAYCGWICSCGALAETLGDQHRQKMPHGPGWNRFNMLGQAFLAFAVVLLVLRIIGWAWPGSFAARGFDYLFDDVPVVNYVWFVDLFWAGILGVGLYWHFSGRVWCRFACPLAALMHVYHRFSRFRILAEKSKCISCGVCTSVCHQGIDVMSFANKGLPMADPQCVRCSACVTECPTGVLYFGQVDRRTEREIKADPPWLAASPVRMTEVTVNGKKRVTV